MWNKFKNWTLDKWNKFKNWCKRFKKWIIGLLIPTAMAAGLTPIALENNAKEFVKPSDIAKECFYKGGTVSRGQYAKNRLVNNKKLVEQIYCNIPNQERIEYKINGNDTKYKEKKNNVLSR